MDLHVAQQAALIQEAFPTLGAGVRALLLMGPLVGGESRPVGEALPTAAGVNSLLLVGLEVSFQGAGRPEAQAAARTSERVLHLFRIHAVSLQVLHQSRPPREGLPAL